MKKNMVTHTFLMYNIKNKNFFIAEGSGDRYATCTVDVDKKYPAPDFHRVCEECKLENFKDVANAWLTPDGHIIPVGLGGHEEAAWDFLNAVEGRDFAIKLSGYGYEELCRRGWLRILTWTRKPTCVGYSTTQKPTPEQKHTLEYWCAVNNHDYDKIFLV